LAIGVFLTVAAMWMPLFRDAGGFLAFGDLIANGAEFYKDYFDRKTPLLFYELGWLFKLVGPSLWWGRLLMLAHTALAAALLLKLGRVLGLPEVWRVALVGAYLIVNPAFDGAEVTTEVPVMLAGTALVWLLLDVRAEIPLPRWFACGLLIGAAAASKQVGILLAPAVGIWLLVDGGFQKRGARRIAAEVAALGIGTALPLAITAAYFASLGSFDAMMHAVFASSLQNYHGEPFFEWAVNLARHQVVRGLFLWLPAAIAGSVALWSFVRRGDERKTALVVLIVLFGLIPSLKRTYAHYVISYLPSLCLLAAVGWRSCVSRLGRNAVILLAAVTFLPMGRHYALWMVPRIARGELGQQIAVAKRIEEYLGPGEPLYVLGSEPKYYFLTGHYHPNRHLFILAEDLHMIPTARLHRVLNATEGLRYVVIVDTALDPVRETVEAIRSRAELVCETDVGELEHVQLYRLPTGWQLPTHTRDGPT